MLSAPFVTIVETRAYLNAAKGLLSDPERSAIVDMVSSDPTCGDLIVGGGGIRKARFAIGGKGKSGGVRIIYFFVTSGLPLFLLTVFAKNERADLSKAQVAALGSVARSLATDYGA